MTGITNLYIGNRQSGKTTKLVEELNINKLNNPDKHHIIISRGLVKKQLEPNKISGNVKIIGEFNGTQDFQGYRDFYLYIDEIDLIPPEKGLELLNLLPSFGIKGLHVNTTPLRLRDKKALNPNHVNTNDPLIKILQITDFDFNFLFNKDTALFYRNSFSGSNKELYYTEGLGLISIFD